MEPSLAPAARRPSRPRLRCVAIQSSSDAPRFFHNLTKAAKATIEAVGRTRGRLRMPTSPLILNETDEPRGVERPHLTATARARNQVLAYLPRFRFSREVDDHLLRIRHVFGLPGNQFHGHIEPSGKAAAVRQQPCFYRSHRYATGHARRGRRKVSLQKWGCTLLVLVQVDKNQPGRVPRSGIEAAQSSEQVRLAICREEWPRLRPDGPDQAFEDRLIDNSFDRA